MKQEIKERIEKIRNGEVPEGYRKTKVGIIPEEWDVKPLEKEIDLLTGFPFPSNQYSKDGVKLLRGSNVKRGETDWTDENTKYWKSVTSELKQYVLNEGDIVIAMDGSLVGRSFARLSNKDLPALLLQRVARVRSNHIDMGYLKEFICSDYFTRYCDTAKTASSIPHISPKDIKNFKIPLPPTRAEQQKIEEILSSWDKAIELKEKLIEEKKEFKRGLMQKLLTGKVRFPEFTDDWKEFQLKDICKFMKGSGLSKEKLSINGKKKCILYGELYTTYSEVIQEVISKTNIVEGVPSQKGDVLIPASTTTSGIDLANATAIEENSVLLGGDINILRNDKSLFNSSFLAYYLTHIKKFDIARKAQGITIIHLYGEHLKKIQVNIPQVQEQEKVAQVISIQNDEIEILTKKLFQLNEQKKGLMQLLLTGIVRAEVD
ncbi:MAG: restriction endonuclease subunit S [Candidatus Methanoperedens sp.]|jgi:type I restriction enzyme S subunit|nr:restriction endonuclease subunit S [Candidatus Methanoperedens sp.]PKL53320.1 MAG: restriction endonuclease subunit S [Candidatus Methanoperedenaceae archaeon HGW-Methanoperedenaceae-1]